jgi:hypothetical protein
VQTLTRTLVDEQIWLENWDDLWLREEECPVLLCSFQLSRSLPLAPLFVSCVVLRWCGAADVDELVATLCHDCPFRNSHKFTNRKGIFQCALQIFLLPRTVSHHFGGGMKFSFIQENGTTERDALSRLLHLLCIARILLIRCITRFHRFCRKPSCTHSARITFEFQGARRRSLFVCREMLESRLGNIFSQRRIDI